MPAPGWESIFVCYRRNDSANAVDHIYEVLKKAHQRPFRDIDSIPVGIDFSNHIIRTLDACSVVLVVIGQGWLDARSEDGRRRLDYPETTCGSKSKLPCALKALLSLFSSVMPRWQVESICQITCAGLSRTLRKTIAEVRQLRLLRLDDYNHGHLLAESYGKKRGWATLTW